MVADGAGDEARGDRRAVIAQDRNQPDEDASAVSMYPVTAEVLESNWSVQVVSGEGVDPEPQTALRFTLSTSFVTNTIF